jgi:hypothetical protein
MSKNIATKILEHPDKDEIISKLIAGISTADIHEGLAAKYVNVGENKFILSEKVLSSFQKDYLDFYTAIKEDLEKTKIQRLTPEEELKLEVQGNPTYRKTLEKYLESELDIKVMVKRVLATIETRIEQMYDLIQEDPRNIKIDRTLIEWFNTLISLLEKYDQIQNGNLEQVNIQNNINIQILDDRINLIYKLIRDVLAKLDYDTSLAFIDMFNEEMQKIQLEGDKEVLPLETRMTEAQLLSQKISAKLDK